MLKVPSTLPRIAAGVARPLELPCQTGVYSAMQRKDAAMSRFVCSRHGGRIVGGVCSLYWAWFTSDGTRVAMKERVCFDCTSAQISSLLHRANDSPLDVSVCPACGTDSSQDMDPIYVDAYLPKSEARKFELTTCAMCAAKIRIPIMQGGERLPDRGGRDGGPQPSTPNPWEALLG